MSARATNRLAAERSPYLRQHAHNPVDWYPWGAEAFARARAEQKPIFLSIGYSTCHWCHVMAHESFENAAVAERLNRDFVPVKVDREERPDVDRLYMTYVQAATGQGGWPMSVWLTPDRKPFYGGTYFPPEDRRGRPGFGSILEALARAWAEERGKLLAEAERVTDALRQYAAGQNPEFQTPGSKELINPEGISTGPETPNPEPRMDDAALAAAAGAAWDVCFQQLQQSFDSAHGGFGGAPKFPRAPVFNFLFRVAAHAKADGGNRIPGSPDQDSGTEGGDRRPERDAAKSLSGIRYPESEMAGAAVQLAAVTLRRMAEGGIHDHVGGGFHRYSVDEEWFVPHFEKMLYDQAQLAGCYLEARQATGDERYAWVARGIFEYVLRDLAGPSGGVCSAEDADSEIPETGPRKAESQAGHGQHAEGAFYVWTKEEIGRELGADADLFCAHFGVDEAGNVPAERDPHGEFAGKNILRQGQPLAETARQAGLELAQAGDRLLAGLARLRAARARRPRPQRDDKILTAWNGLMISALAKGCEVLAEPSLGDQAGRVAEFLRRGLYDEATGGLYRSYRDGRSDISGFAEDYAYLVQGLLDLYEAAFDIRWLQWAERLQAKMDELFWDAGTGGYFNSRADDPAIIARLKEDYDGAEPAPSSVAAMNLVRLSWLLGEEPGAGKPAGPAASRGERARRCIEAFHRQWSTAPQALPQMLCALELALQPPRTVVIAGRPAADDFRALAAVLHERLGPRHAVLAADGGAGQAWLAGRQPYLAEMRPLGGRAAAYVCENLTCRPPVTEPAELRRLLDP
jgi:uncharacterized protein YyaL (SSP411 family)